MSTTVAPRTIGAGSAERVLALREIEGFLDEVVGPVLERGPGGGDIAVGRDHDRLGLGLEGADGFEHPDAGILAVGGHAILASGGGHAEIGDNNIEGAVAQLVEGGAHAGHDRADVAGLAQGVGHDLGVVGLIINNQDLGGGGFGHAARS